MNLFKEEINGWESWGKIFQSIGAFEPLVREICARRGLPFSRPENLTPGTNAVFRVDDMVIKIYAPAESGCEQKQTELAAMLHAKNVGAPSPKVIAAGEISDKYRFSYLVMEYVEAREAGDVIHSMSGDLKAAFAENLRGITKKLNAVPAIPGIPDDTLEILSENRRWDVFPKCLREEILSRTEELHGGEIVFVHGDLTGENVLITAKNEIMLIDFGDCHLAPAFYELTPLVFDLFRRDPALLRAYFGDGWKTGEFLDTLTKSVLLHDFGGSFIAGICDETGVDKGTIRRVSDIRKLIEKILPE